MKVRANLSRAFGASILLAFAVGSFFLILQPQERAATKASVSSAEAEGRRALFLILDELGFEPRIWHQAPVGLPSGEHVLWLSRPPAGLGDGELASEAPAGDDPSLGDPRHPLNYGEFVRAGGTLVAPATERMLAWLRAQAGLEVPAWRGMTSSGEAQHLTLDTGEELHARVHPEPLEERGELEDWHAIVTAAGGENFAAWCELGAGRVVLLASDDFLSNEALRSEDNALLAVRLVESLDRGGDLLFDEYALGNWQPPSSYSVLAAPGLREVTWHAIFFVLCVLIFSGWRREFPRDPEAQPMNPRMRAKASARLYERASRYDLLAHELRLGVLRRLVRHWKLTRRGSVLTEDATPENMAELAREVALRAGRSEAVAAQWAALFGTESTERRAEFAALAIELRELERELELDRRKSRQH